MQNGILELSRATLAQTIDRFLQKIEGVFYQREFKLWHFSVPASVSRRITCQRSHLARPEHWPSTRESDSCTAPTASSNYKRPKASAEPAPEPASPTVRAA